MKNPLQTVQFNIAQGVIELGIGQPGFSLLPLELLHSAATHRLSQPDRTILQYGAGAGDGRFRYDLAAFLTTTYDTPITPDSLFVTAGASQGLDLVCAQLTRPGDVVFVEEPSYFLALRILQDRGLKVVGVPMDQEGLKIEALTEKLATYQPRFLYTIPTFQNPTGTTLSPARREVLLHLSEKHDFYIVADEVYQSLHYTEMPPPPFATQIAQKQVISLNSFSKILAPGLRLGWLQAAPDFLEKASNAGVVQSGGGLNPFTSAIVRSLLSNGRLSNHINQLRTTYGERARALTEAVTTHFGDIATFNTPHGGLFLWLTLPEKYDTAKLLPIAQAKKVSFQPGHRFYTTGQSNQLRLSFAFFDNDDLTKGVRRLRQAINQL